MKNIQILKTSYLILMMISFTALFSCNNNEPKKEDSKEMANDMNDENMDDRGKEKDAQFLVDATDISLTEIKLGELAKMKSKSKDIKEMGEMMIVDHNKALNEGKELAASKGVTLPTSVSEKTQKKYDELNALNEKDFNKEYSTMMVDGHKDAIDIFEKRADKTEDVDIKNWANNTLPALREHLKHAEHCKEMCEK